MSRLIKTIASGWRGMLACACFVAGAELYRREDMRLSAERTARTAEAITREPVNGS